MFNMRNFRIGSRLIATTVGALSLMIAFVVVALISLGMIGEKVQTIAVDNARNMEMAGAMQRHIDSLGLRARNALLFEEISRQREEERGVARDIEQILANERELGSGMSASAHDILQRLPQLRDDASASLSQFFGLVTEGNRPALEAHFDSHLLPRLRAWQEAIDRLGGEQKASTAAALKEIASIREVVQNLLFGLIVLAVVVMIPSGIWVTRGITNPLSAAVEVAESVAAGDFDNQIDPGGKDEPAHLLRSLARMQSDLKHRSAEERRIAAEALRIKVALDVGSNCVMLLDKDGRVIYGNEALVSMMRHAEADIRQVLPTFQAALVRDVGFSVHELNPSFGNEQLAALSEPARSEIRIAGRTFALVVTPVHGEAGVRLGTVIEWQDRTGEVAIEQEVSEIIEAAAAGDFSQRISCDSKRGFFLRLASGVNGLLDANAQALEEVGCMLDRLARGDLTEKIRTPYQGLLGKVRDDANSTVDKLCEIVLAIKEATDSINTAAREIAQGNQDLSGRTEQQASSLEETASSMEQLTGTVHQNADNARRANELAGEAKRVAEQGGGVVGEVVVTMSSIQKASARIADIIGVIDGIAFQTNILALNAAVEAARAGEQGRGFAVVATEVRSLAQRSAAAAKEIKALIADSVNKVDAGNRLVERAGATMSEIVSSIQGVARLMAEISEASREQSSGIEQVGRAINQMDEVTQQNAALVEEAAAAAESLRAQAQRLALAVAAFHLAPEVVPALAWPESQGKKPQDGQARLIGRQTAARLSTSTISRKLLIEGESQDVADDGGWTEF